MLAAVIGVAAQERAGTVTDAPPPIDAIMRPHPLDPMVRRVYRNNPDCVSAKVDIWFGAGGYSHQLFTSKGLDRGADFSGRTPTTQETWQGEGRNPETRSSMLIARPSSSDVRAVAIGFALSGWIELLIGQAC